MLDFAFLFCRLKLDDFVLWVLFCFLGYFLLLLLFFIYLFVLLKEYIYCVLDFAFFSCRLQLHKGLLIF